MPKIGQRRKDPVTGAHGELVRLIETTEIYRADDGTFFKRETGKSYSRIPGATTGPKARYPAGSIVWLRVKDVEKPVKAVAIGAGQFRCIEDKVWSGCILDDREAKPIGEAA